MKTLLTLLLLCVPAFGQIRSLGTITTTNGIAWDPSTSTNVNSYRVYVGDTNGASFAPIATVSTNRWPGDSTKDINGPRAVYIASLTATGVESDPSEKVIVTFRAGVPLPPTNIQLYSIVTAAATNALPKL